MNKNKIKIEIAKELLKNSKNIYISVLIKEYIENISLIENNQCRKKEVLRLDTCISYIQKVKFDITGWQLNEVPIFYAYCFLNEKTKEYFDLAALDRDKVCPMYLDENSNEKVANSIKEAIVKYHVKNYFS